MRVVFTCDVRAQMAHYLSGKPDCLAYTVTSLSLAERSAAVRAMLGRYGKVLNESGFRNQVSTVPSFEIILVIIVSSTEECDSRDPETVLLGDSP